MVSIPVVLCFDSRIILGASATIKSLLDCAKDETIYDIRILHSDLSLKEQKNLTSLAEGTRHNISFHYIDPKIFKNAPKSKGSWTEIVYYRFLSSSILPEYEKAIYSDVDVLFKDDLSELYNTDITDYEFGAVRAEKNSPNNIGHKYFEENKNEYIYWSGLLLINNKKFNDEKILEKLLENAQKFNERLKFFDLDLVNITCNKFKELPLKYCLLQSLAYQDDYTKAKEYSYLKEIYSDEEILEAKKNPAILHYAGKPGKPWRMKKPYPDYKEYMDNLPKALKQFTLRDIRKKLFNKV